MKVYAAMMDHRMSLHDVGPYAARMEALGYDGLHVPEAVHDPFVVAAIALEHTSRIQVRTAVALAFVRSPMLTAYTAWDLARFSNSRFEVGLGTQIRAHISERFGMPFDEPSDRLADYIDAMRASFHAFQSGAAPEHRGRFYSVTRLSPFFNPGAIDVAPPSIWVGGVGVKVTTVAGTHGDGLISHPTNSNPRYLDAVTMPALRKGAEAQGRSYSEIGLVVGSLNVTAMDERGVALRREAQKQPLAFTLSTPAYWPTLEMYGWLDVGHRLRAMTRANEWDRMVGVLSDEIFDTLVPQATYAEFPDVVREWYGARASGIVLEPPGDPADDPAFREMIAVIGSE
ncbi:TIGR03617 family F420-dependent LLM class oxidoreductase [Mycobacterium kyogaense]|uniref:TIGR03617 family F420-dependent LLM class oxidoreductase n=1 Tax=Mycobacterium kyogaense TaxID=2212479 RepID=UPI001F0978AC|nr:TIGR03617 family F420-dependent LLM class oxidoreductase [Mycobacterium kyogaense]